MNCAFFINYKVNNYNVTIIINKLTLLRQQTLRYHNIYAITFNNIINFEFYVLTISHIFIYLFKHFKINNDIK